MITKLAAQQLGAKVKTDEGEEGVIRAYSNREKWAFVATRDGAPHTKHDYSELTLVENGTL